MDVVQSGILDAIEVLAKESLKNVDFTKSYTGLVKEIDGSSCTVEAFGELSECTIPLGLQSFVGVNDVVVIQAVRGNLRLVQGSISSINEFIFYTYDTEEDLIVSSVIDIWDEGERRVVNASSIVLE